VGAVTETVKIEVEIRANDAEGTSGSLGIS